jgi:hypothetical protein
VKKFNRLFLLSALVLTIAPLYNNCSNRQTFSTDGPLKPAEETNTGNPITSEINVKLGSIDSSQVTALSVCPESVSWVPSNPSMSPVQFGLQPAKVTLGASDIILGTVTVPSQKYDRVELTLSSSACASQKSIQVTNANGSYAGGESVTVKFTGPVEITDLTRTLTLEMQPIVDGLADITTDSDLQVTVETVNGLLVPMNAPTFIQLQEVSVTNTANGISIPPFSSSVTPGNVIFCVVFYDANSTGHVVSDLNDSGGHGYNRVTAAGEAAGGLTGWVLETWASVGPIVNGGPLSVTASFSGSIAGEKGLSCHEYSGVSAAGIDGNVSSNEGFSANAVVGPLQNTHANDLIFAVALFEGPASSGPGFVQRSSLGNLVTQDKAINTIGLHGATFSNPEGNWLFTLMLVKGF